MPRKKKVDPDKARDAARLVWRLVILWALTLGWPVGLLLVLITVCG